MAWQHEVKAQPIRLLDVFLVGPLMIHGGRKVARFEPVAGNVLTLLGVLTIWYNGRNYLRIEEERKRG